MKKLIRILIVMFSFTMKAQTEPKPDKINPKGKWFFGVELGRNTITSTQIQGEQSSFQAGALAEYYFAKHWSVSARIKHFETGVSVNNPGSGGGSSFLSFSTPGVYQDFEGAVLCIPINIKWEFRISKNLSGNLKTGPAFNWETKSEYAGVDYGNVLGIIKDDKYPTDYVSFNFGYGLNYFLTKKIALYLDVETYVGAPKASREGFFGTSSYVTVNSLTNFGLKYSFK